jgi:hypothetical protein
MKPFFYILGLLILNGVCLAQAESSEESRSNYKISCLYWEGKPSEVLYFREGEHFRRLEFKQAQRSKGFSLRGMSNFELYRKAAQPEAGKPPYELLSDCKIPNAAEILFVVIPYERKGALLYHVHAMDDTLGTFPRGSFRFVNYTTESIQIKCGKKTQQIAPLGLWSMTGTATKNGGFIPFVLGDSNGDVIYGTRIFGQPSGRELVFIIPPAKKGGTPRVKFISQLISP